MTKHIAMTSAVLVGAVLLFECTNIDLLIQDHLYNFELKQWILDRNEKISKFLLYDGIKKVFIAFILLVMAGLLFFSKTKLIQQYRQGLLIVCLSGILIPLTINALKATTNVPCPRDLVHYGGKYPYVTVLEEYPASFHQTKNIKCYPAGHASGGFALLSLFFLFKRRRNQVIALISTVTLGWVLGTYKVVIGDHFVGHTVVTMILAWLIILIVAKSVRYRASKVDIVL